MKKINNIKVKILTFLMILVFINSMSCFLLGIGGLGGSNSGSNSVLKKNFSPWICPYCGGKYAFLIKSVHLVHCTNKKSVNTQNPVTTPVNTQSPGSIIGNNSSGFIQSNTTGWTMKAAPSPTENYTVIITGPARVWENIKSKGQTIGWQNNPVPYSGSTGYPLKAWIFTLPPATGTEISLSFYGEKTFDIPYSNQTSITSSKQIAWITKTFPIVKKIKLPVPIVGSRTYDVITPPGIVQEDVKCSWTIDNPSDIFLKLDTYVEYEWSFPNPPGSPLIKRGRIKVDKNTSTKVLGLKLRASHVFKEAGIYDISLNLKFTEVIQNGDKIEEVLRNYDYMKSVIVVEHIPEYIGNVLASISPPIIVKEDIDNLFLFKTMFTFTKKLPENMCTLVDRFEGVEPGTITYSIDWGDGEVSPKIDYPNTEKTLIGDNPIPAVRYIKIEGVTHNYLEPGNYTVRLLITYYEKHYEEYPIKSDTGQIIGYDYKLIGPFTHIATKNITVWDQTPPVIVNGSFSDLEATSGDPLEIKLEVSDNHPSEAITSAKIHFMLYPAQWNGDDAPEEWKKIDANLESIGNSTWLISGKVDIPVDFATKKFAGNTLKNMKTLSYYVEIEDATGNVNIGDPDIVDNHDFDNKYDANGLNIGKITVIDNDPPNIMVVFECKQDQRIFTFEANGGEKDFTIDPSVHGQVKKCCSASHSSSTCEMINMTENPIHGNNPSTITPIKYVSDKYIFREDTRIKLHWIVNDAVDGILSLKSEKLELNDNNIIFTTSGIKKIDFYAFDNKNPDSTSNGRKLLIDFIIQKLLMSRKILNNE